MKSNSDFDSSRLHVVETLEEAMKLVPTLDSGEEIVLLENDLPDNY